MQWRGRYDWYHWQNMNLKLLSGLWTGHLSEPSQLYIDIAIPRKLAQSKEHSMEIEKILILPPIYNSILLSFSSNFYRICDYDKYFNVAVATTCSLSKHTLSWYVYLNIPGSNLFDYNKVWRWKTIVYIMNLYSFLWITIFILTSLIWPKYSINNNLNFYLNSNYESFLLHWNKKVLMDIILILITVN